MRAAALPNVALPNIELGDLDDRTLAARAAGRDFAAVRLITERNNRRLFRAAWAVLKDRAEAEDVVQEAYAKAFAAIAGSTAKPAFPPGSHAS